MYYPEELLEEKRVVESEAKSIVREKKMEERKKDGMGSSCDADHEMVCVGDASAIRR